MTKNTSQIYKILILIMFLVISLFSQNHSKEQNSTQNLIHYGDLIDVDVLGSTEFDWRGTLTPEGFLDGVDFVDESIYALCQSEESVAGEVAKGFSKILRNPQVVVKILDKSGRSSSFIYGAIRTPQRLQIQRQVKLSEIIILSGGFDEKASGEIQIIRTGNLNCENQNKTSSEINESQNVKINQPANETKVFNINIADVLNGSENSNPAILTGDIITVKEAEPIYVIGAVGNPRKINSRSQITLTRAIASAGGITRNADTKKIFIYRRNNKDTQVLELDYDKIKSGSAEDIELKKYDIIEIRQNGSDTKRFPPVLKVLEAEKKSLELPLRIID